MQATGLGQWLAAGYERLLVAMGVVLRRRGAAEAGQSMVEYSIIVALIAVAAMVAVQALGGGIAQVFTNILTRISGIGS
jgi:Flp pilus assembly pilin Flp